MHAALPRPTSDADHTSGSTLSGLIAHLDAVYAFALALTSNPDAASALTERVYQGVTRDLWSTLGGHSLRDRLLARCFTIFTQELHEPDRGVQGTPPMPDLLDVLAGLPRGDRAAVTLVDRIGLTYASGAAVLGTTVDEFRTALHRGRGTLMAASRMATAW